MNDKGSSSKQVIATLNPQAKRADSRLKGLSEPILGQTSPSLSPQRPLPACHNHNDLHNNQRPQIEISFLCNPQVVPSLLGSPPTKQTQKEKNSSRFLIQQSFREHWHEVLVNWNLRLSRQGEWNPGGHTWEVETTPSVLRSLPLSGPQQPRL